MKLVEAKMEWAWAADDSNARSVLIAHDLMRIRNHVRAWTGQTTGRLLPVDCCNVLKQRRAVSTLKFESRQIWRLN